MRPIVQQAIQQLHTVGVLTSDVLQTLRLFRVVVLERLEPLGLHPVAADLVEDFNLVEGGFEVVACGTLDL